MLGSQLEVSFEPHTPGDYDGLQGLIALSGAAEAARDASLRNISCYEVISFAANSFRSTIGDHIYARQQRYTARFAVRRSPIPA